MLKRASRAAPQMTYANVTIQPRRTSWSLKAPAATDRTPQANAKKAGAKPKVMTSARESNSRPKFELALVMRAMRPSRPSKRIAQPMARAAASKDVIE